MKCTKLILLLLLPIVLFSSFLTPDYRFTGKWRGTFRGETGTITFDDEGFVFATYRNIKYGGKEYKLNGRLTNVTYEINDNVDPKGIDFVLKTVDDNQELLRFQCIYDFLGDGKLKVCFDLSGQQRPKGFEADNSLNQIILDKVE